MSQPSLPHHPDSDPDLVGAMRRVGTVLVVLGLAVVTYEVATFSADPHVALGLSPVAVVGGLLLWTGRPRFARWAVFLSALGIAVQVGLTLAYPLLLPRGYLVLLASAATADVLRPFLPALFTTCLLGWVHLWLSSALPRDEVVVRRRRGLAWGCCVPVAFLLMMVAIRRSDVAELACRSARAEVGPRYRCFVNSISFRRWSSEPEGFDAQVTVYTATEAHTVHVQGTR